MINTEYMTKLTAEINRLETPAKLTTDTTHDPSYLVEVGAPFHTAGSNVFEVLVSGESSNFPGDPGSLVFGVFDQDWRAQYVDPEKHTPEELAAVVVQYHRDMVRAGVYS